MSLVLASSHVTTTKKPTVLLQEALTNFESMLTLDERQRLHSGAVMPGASGILGFVGQIDSNNKSREGRCVAQRLCRFLESIQQFTGVVNTFVSSNPAIAALVWGSVKLTVLTASNVASFFDKVTEMIMRLGKYCPLYRQFGALYPGHLGVQQSLCDYYAVIIRICTKIVEISHRKSLFHTVSSVFIPFEAEFAHLLDEVKEAASIFNLQISLASKEAAQKMQQAQQVSTKQNQLYQRVALKFQDDAKREYDEAREWRIQQGIREINQLKTSIKDNLSTTDHLKPWKQAARQTIRGTAQWIVQDQTFCDWRDSNVSDLLWCSGRMGSGKTILASQVITNLYTFCRKTDIISFYFCRKDDEASLSPRNLLGSIARQALENHIEVLNETDLRKLHSVSKGLDANDLTKLLVDNMNQSKNYYIILDGLDECDEEAIRVTIDCLDQISMQASSHCVKILCTGRAELEGHLARKFTLNHRIVLSKDRVNQDIDIALDALISQKIDDGVLKLGDTSLISQISSRLRQESDGIFLWVILVLDEICSRNSDYSIMEALDTLPRGFSQLMDQKIDRILKHNEAADATKLLEYIAVVKRPLTILECQEALSVTLDQQSLDPRKFINDLNTVVSRCRGLLFIDEEESTIHYIHQSVQTYLFSSARSPLEHKDITLADHHFGILCITYLSFSNFGRQVVKAKQVPRSSNDAIDIGLATLSQQKGMSSRIAQKILLRHRKAQQQTNTSVERSVLDVIISTELDKLKSEVARQYYFIEYARAYWYQHLTSLEQNSDQPRYWSLFCKFVGGHENAVTRPWEDVLSIEAQDGYIEAVSMLRWAAKNGHSALLCYALNTFKEAREPHVLRVILGLVMASNSVVTLQALKPYRFSELRDPTNVLIHAASIGNLHMVEQAIKAGAEINSQFTTTFIFNAINKKSELGESLQSSSGLMDAYSGYPKLPGDNALATATRNEHVDVVRRLLELGADPDILGMGGNDVSDDTYRPIHTAVHINSFECLRALLDAGADVNAPSVGGYTALMLAALEGRSGLLDVLSAKGANPNLVKPGFQAPLHIVMKQESGGQLTNVNSLLAAEADPDVRADSEQPALHMAIARGQRAIAVCLIAKGADVDLFDKTFPPPIVIAVRAREPKIVARLITANANINVRINEDGHTPIQEALWAGDVDIVKLLLDAGAQVHYADIMALTLLFTVLPPNMNIIGRPVPDVPA